MAKYQLGFGILTAEILAAFFLFLRPVESGWNPSTQFVLFRPFSSVPCNSYTFPTRLRPGDCLFVEATSTATAPVKRSFICIDTDCTAPSYAGRIFENSQPVAGYDKMEPSLQKRMDPSPLSRSRHRSVAALVALDMDVVTHAAPPNSAEHSDLSWCTDLDSQIGRAHV